MKKFEGVLICTDLDGTLLNDSRVISAENKEAIEYFKSEGGSFTFVTGRMPFYALDLYEKVRPNVPVGCVNGGGVYDFVSGKYIYTVELPKSVCELVRCVDNALPDVGIQVNTFQKVYFCKENKTMEGFRRITGVSNLKCGYDEIEEPMAKIIFGCETESEIQAVISILSSHPRTGEFDYIRSEKTLFEILPKGVGKGNAVKNLAEYLGIDVARTVAIGDYNNDISMFKAAGISIAVNNATPDAKAAARFMTVSNNEHAVARVIYDIEKGVYPI